MTMRARVVAAVTLHTSQIEATGDRVEGMPVLVVAGSRVVLPPGSNHFRPVVPCARCQADTAAVNSPVRSTGDLQRRDERRFCARCVSGHAVTLGADSPENGRGTRSSDAPRARSQVGDAGALQSGAHGNGTNGHGLALAYGRSEHPSGSDEPLLPTLHRAVAEVRVHRWSIRLMRR